MKRPKHLHRDAPDSLSELQNRRQQQKEALKARLNAKTKNKAGTPKTQVVKRPAEKFDPRNIIFARSGNLQNAVLSEGVVSAVSAFRRAVSEQQSSVILNWPRALPGVSVVHGIAFLCELAEGPELYRGLSTVFYPASARTGANQRALLVDRTWLIEVNKPWLNSLYPKLRTESANAEPTQAKFHKMVARVQDLRTEALANFKRAKAVVDRTVDREHPTLFELTPRRSLDSSGALKNPEDFFLERSRKLSELLTHEKNAADHQRVEAVEPKTTPWLLSAIHGASPMHSWTTCTAPSHRKPDVVLIDLQYRARARLGENWRRELSDIASRMRHGDPDLPIVAVTDDPFVAAFVKFELAIKQKGNRKTRPLPVDLIRQNATSLLENRKSGEGPIDRSSGKLFLEIEVFASDLAEFATNAMRVRRHTASLANGTIARSIGVCLSRMRMLANSPVSQAAVIQAFDDPYEPHVSNRLLESFNIGASLAELRAIAPRAGNLEAEIVALVEEAQELAIAFSSSAEITTRKMLRSRLETLPRRGTRTLVVASGVSAAQLLERWIENDPDLSDVSDRLGEKFDIVTARDAITEVEIAAASTRPYGHVLLISPPPREALALLCNPACPSKVELLVDASSAKFLADYGDALLKAWPEKEPGFAQIHSTVEAVRAKLQSSIADLPNLELGDPSTSGLQILDMTVQAHGSEGRVFKITTVDGDTIHANPQTVFVSRKQADLENFEYLHGDKIVPGREILVPGTLFLESLQSAHEFRAAAAPLLADYHAAVRDRADQLAGDNLRSKAQQILKVMHLAAIELPTLDSVQRWLDVARQDDVPMELRAPQAPRLFKHFRTFCDALGIDDTLIEIYWTYAITATRGGRIRSGLQLRKLYASALIDPDAVLRANKSAGPLIEKIRDLSAEHVSEVLHIERIESEGL